MDNMDKLVNAICLSILSVPNLDVSTIDFELAKVIRSRNEELTKPLLDKIKKAVMDRLRDAFDNNELGGIPGIAINDYTSTVQAAKQGQDVDLVQLLCPKKLRSGEVVSFAAGHELPPGFDMSTCPTTNVLSHLLNILRDKPNTTVKVGEVRWECQEDCCGGYKHCQKCTPEEGMPLAKVYSLLALLFFLVGGRFNFYNVGGKTTKIKENLASKLDKRYFGIIKDSGYHLSLATYLLPCFVTFENGATRLTNDMKNLCDKMGIPQAFADMVANDKIPMIVDLDRVDEFKQRWKRTLSTRQMESYKALANAWKERVERDGLDAALAHMRELGRKGGLASWEARVERDGLEAACEHMAELGRRGHAVASKNVGGASELGRRGHAGAEKSVGSASELGRRGHAVASENAGGASELSRRGHAVASENAGGASEFARRGLEKATKNCGGVNPVAHWVKSASFERHSKKNKISAATQKKNGNGAAVYQEDKGRENNLALGMVEQGDLVQMMCTLCGVEKASRWKFHENGVMKVVLFRCYHIKEDGKRCMKNRRLLNGCNLPTISKGALQLRAEKKKKK